MKKATTTRTQQKNYITNVKRENNQYRKRRPRKTKTKDPLENEDFESEDLENEDLENEELRLVQAEKQSHCLTFNEVIKNCRPK